MEQHSLKEYTALKIVDKLSFIYKGFGIDYPIMRRILQLKLTMDRRRVPSIVANSNNDKEDNAFRNSLLMYLLMGLFIGIVILVPLPTFMDMSLVLGALLFMIMTSMISDFSTVLLDVADKNILLPMPVKANTINAAKITHIFIYLFTITMTISAPTLIFGTIKFQLLFLPIFLVDLVMICGFIIFFTSLFYFLIMIFFDGEKLKDIINFFQIALSVIMMVSYQIVPRLFNFMDLKYTYMPKLWHALLPTTWFAAPFSVILEGNRSPLMIFFAALGILVPILSLAIYFKGVMPYFEKNLQKLNNNGSRKNSTLEKKINFRRAITKIFCKDRIEAIFCNFTESMMSNERKLKLRLYPTLAFSVFMPFLMLFSFMQGETSISQMFSDLSNGDYFLVIYMGTLMVSIGILSAYCSDNYKAAWIYNVMPLESPGPVIKGAIVGYMLKFSIPIFLLLSIIFLALCGFKIILDLCVIFVIMIFMTLLIYNLCTKELPFYKQFTKSQGGNTGVVFLIMFLGLIFAGVHALMRIIPFGLPIYFIIISIVTIFWWKHSFKLTWDRIGRT